ncbi:MAG: hypothetical protein WCT35_08745 [Sideroxydans sp.]|jgi:hypothetical protein
MNTTRFRSGIVSFLHQISILATLTGLLTSTALAQGEFTQAPIIKVGDQWKFEQSDRRSGVKEPVITQRITSISPTQIEGLENEERFVWTPELNLIESPTVIVAGEGNRLAFPLEVGKTWEYQYNFTNKAKAAKGRWKLEATVVAYEKVKVPAGEFDAFKIEYSGFWHNDTKGKSGRLKMTNWYAPAVHTIVRNEFEDGLNDYVRVLLEVQLQP